VILSRTDSIFHLLLSNNSLSFLYKCSLWLFAISLRIILRRRSSRSQYFPNPSELFLVSSNSSLISDKIKLPGWSVTVTESLFTVFFLRRIWFLIQQTSLFTFLSFNSMLYKVWFILPQLSSIKLDIIIPIYSYSFC